MNSSNLRNSVSRSPTPFEPPTRPPAAPNIAPAAPAPRLSGLPEIDHAEERLKVEKARFDQATAQLDAAKEAVNAARNQSNIAIRKRAVETELLAVARREFGIAISAGEEDTQEVQRRITDAQMKIDALTSLIESAGKDAQRAEGTLAGFQDMVGKATQGLEDAELKLLIKQYAQALVPLIPLARQIHRLAPQMMGELGGYLINVRRAKIGSYIVHDDGTLSFQLN